MNLILILFVSYCLFNQGNVYAADVAECSTEVHSPISSNLEQLQKSISEIDIQTGEGCFKDMGSDAFEVTTCLELAKKYSGKTLTENLAKVDQEINSCLEKKLGNNPTRLSKALGFATLQFAREFDNRSDDKKRKLDQLAESGLSFSSDGVLNKDLFEKKFIPKLKIDSKTKSLLDETLGSKASESLLSLYDPNQRQTGKLKALSLGNSVIIPNVTKAPGSVPEILTKDEFNNRLNTQMGIFTDGVKAYLEHSATMNSSWGNAVDRLKANIFTSEVNGISADKELSAQTDSLRNQLKRLEGVYGVNTDALSTSLSMALSQGNKDYEGQIQKMTTVAHATIMAPLAIWGSSVVITGLIPGAVAGTAATGTATVSSGTAASATWGATAMGYVMAAPSAVGYGTMIGGAIAVGGALNSAKAKSSKFGGSIFCYLGDEMVQRQLSNIGPLSMALNLILPGGTKAIGGAVAASINAGAKSIGKEALTKSGVKVIEIATATSIAGTMKAKSYHDQYSMRASYLSQAEEARARGDLENAKLFEDKASIVTRDMVYNVFGDVVTSNTVAKLGQKAAAKHTSASRDQSPPKTPVKFVPLSDVYASNSNEPILLLDSPGEFGKVLPKDVKVVDHHGPYREPNRPNRNTTSKVIDSFDSAETKLKQQGKNNPTPKEIRDQALKTTLGLKDSDALPQNLKISTDNLGDAMVAQYLIEHPEIAHNKESKQLLRLATFHEDFGHFGSKTRNLAQTNPKTAEAVELSHALMAVYDDVIIQTRKTNPKAFQGDDRFSNLSPEEQSQIVSSAQSGIGNVMNDLQYRKKMASKFESSIADSKAQIHKEALVTAKKDEKSWMVLSQKTLSLEERGSLDSNVTILDGSKYSGDRVFANWGGKGEVGTKPYSLELTPLPNGKTKVILSVPHGQKDTGAINENLLIALKGEKGESSYVMRDSGLLFNFAGTDIPPAKIIEIVGREVAQKKSSQNKPTAVVAKSPKEIFLSQMPKGKNPIEYEQIQYLPTGSKVVVKAEDGYQLHGVVLKEGTVGFYGYNVIDRNGHSFTSHDMKMEPIIISVNDTSSHRLIGKIREIEIKTKYRENNLQGFSSSTSKINASLPESISTFPEVVLKNYWGEDMIFHANDEIKIIDKYGERIGVIRENGMFENQNRQMQPVESILKDRWSIPIIIRSNVRKEAYQERESIRGYD